MLGARVAGARRGCRRHTDASRVAAPPDRQAHVRDHFSGRRLRPGRYAAAVSTTDSAGNRAAPVRIALRAP